MYPPLSPRSRRFPAGGKTGGNRFRRVGRSTDESAHLSDSVLHTLFAASGARARVTSVGREEGDINFCRDRRFYAPSLCARHPRFDGCSFVVRSLNAGAGKERSIFNLRLHAKREERKSTNDTLCDTHTHVRKKHTSIWWCHGRDNAWNSAGTRRGKKKKKCVVVCCCFRIAPLTVRFMLFDKTAAHFADVLTRFKFCNLLKKGNYLDWYPALSLSPPFRSNFQVIIIRSFA